MILHEWALAEAIVKASLEAARSHNAKRIKRIEIVLGDLQTIDKEVLSFALKELTKDTIARDAEIVFISEKPRFRCNICGYEWSIDDVHNLLPEDIVESIHFIPELALTFLECPKCHKKDFDIISGRGLYLKGIEVE